MPEMPLLEVRDLSVSFRTEEGVVRAVDSLSFSLGQGEVLGIVGESGSGKTVSMLSVMRLIRDPNAVVEGQVLHRGRDLIALSQREMQSVRGCGDRDDLPGSDDGADAGLPGRLADRRADARARAAERAGRPGAHGRAAPRGRDPQREPTRRGLPAPVLGRDAAARDDRDGALVQSLAADRRRADDGARRDDPGSDPGADEAPPARSRLLDRPHHPRHGRRRRPRRARGRDVRGQRDRGGLEDGRLPRSAAPVHVGAARFDAAHRPAAAAPARRDPGHAASLLAPPEGCRFAPRCVHRFERCSTRPALAERVAPGRKDACHLDPPFARRSGRHRWPSSRTARARERRRRSCSRRWTSSSTSPCARARGPGASASTCTPSTASRSRCGAARRSASSASRAAASRRSAGCWCGCTSRRVAPSGSTGRTSRASRGRRCAPSAARCR